MPENGQLPDVAASQQHAPVVSLPTEDKLTPIQKLMKLDRRESGGVVFPDAGAQFVPLPVQPNSFGTLRAESVRNELPWAQNGGMINHKPHAVRRAGR